MCGESALRTLLDVTIGLVAAALISLGLAMVANGSFYGAIAAPALVAIVGMGLVAAGGMAGSLLIRIDNFVICRRRGRSPTACQAPLNLAKVELVAIILALATASISAFVVVAKSATPIAAQLPMIVLFVSVNATLLLLFAYRITFIASLIRCLSNPLVVTPPVSSGPPGPPAAPLGPHAGNLTIEIYSCPFKEPKCQLTAMARVPPRTLAATDFIVAQKSIILIQPTTTQGDIIGMAVDVSDSSGTTIPLSAKYISSSGSVFFNGGDTNWLVEINALELDKLGHLKIDGLRDNWTVTCNADVAAPGGTTLVVSRVMNLIITKDT